MMIRFRRLFAPLIFVLLPLGLVACETPVQVETLPDLTFAHLKPIKLNVAKLEVVSQYQATLTAPYVEHLFPTPPVKALKQWAKDRFRAVGRSGTARLVILDATAIEVQLQKKTGLKASFTKQQSQRYAVSANERSTIWPPFISSQSPGAIRMPSIAGNSRATWARKPALSWWCSALM